MSSDPQPQMMDTQAIVDDRPLTRFGLFSHIPISTILLLLYLGIVIIFNVLTVVFHGFLPDQYDKWLKFSHSIPILAAEYFPSIDIVVNAMSKNHYDNRILLAENVLSINFVLWFVFCATITFSIFFETRKNRKGLFLELNRIYYYINIPDKMTSLPRWLKENKVKYTFDYVCNYYTPFMIRFSEPTFFPIYTWFPSVFFVLSIMVFVMVADPIWDATPDSWGIYYHDMGIIYLGLYVIFLEIGHWLFVFFLARLFLLPKYVRFWR